MCLNFGNQVHLVSTMIYMNRYGRYKPGYVYGFGYFSVFVGGEFVTLFDVCCYNM